MQVVISGLHKTPKTFKLSTVIRILVKYGATRYELSSVLSCLERGKPATFKHFEMMRGNVDGVSSECKSNYSEAG